MMKLRRATELQCSTIDRGGKGRPAALLRDGHNLTFSFPFRAGPLMLLSGRFSCFGDGSRCGSPGHGLFLQRPRRIHRVEANHQLRERVTDEPQPAMHRGPREIFFDNFGVLCALVFHGDVGFLAFGLHCGLGVVG